MALLVHVCSVAGWQDMTQFRGGDKRTDVIIAAMIVRMRDAVCPLALTAPDGKRRQRPGKTPGTCGINKNQASRSLRCFSLS